LVSNDTRGPYLRINFSSFGSLGVQRYSTMGSFLQLTDAIDT